MPRRTAETSADGDATPIVLEIPGSDRDLLEARLASAERELRRIEMRTHGQNGDLRNARRHEIAEAVRTALDPEWRLEFRKRAREWTYRYHHPNRIVLEHCRAYQEVLQGDR